MLIVPVLGAHCLGCLGGGGPYSCATESLGSLCKGVSCGHDTIKMCAAALQGGACPKGFTRCAAISPGIPKLAWNWPQGARLATGSPVLPNSAMVSGGQSYTFSISPELPLAMQLDATTGTVSGVPLAPQPPLRYKLTATDATGNGKSVTATEVLEFTSTSTLSKRSSKSMAATKTTTITAAVADVPKHCWSDASPSHFLQGCAKRAGCGGGTAPRPACPGRFSMEKLTKIRNYQKRNNQKVDTPSLQRTS